jgi:23S rRNA (guanosine2251-2'-O)-methyltransferase
VQLICGINPVLEALGARERHFDRLLVVKGLRNRRVSEAIARASHLGIPLRFEAREMLDRMAGSVPHQGLIAVVSAKPMMDLDALLEQARTPVLLVVLDGVEDPRNLGAIVRTAEAAGADGVVLPERHSAGLSETVARASAGALEHVKVAQIGNVAQALDRLKERGIWVVGFDAAGRERWDAVDLKRPVALVLGGEGRGMRRLVRERCDHLVSLPLFGHVGSLNVSVAAGIALYEAVRQRGAVPSHVRPIATRPVAPGPRVVGPAPDDGEDDPGRMLRAGAAAEGADGEDGDAAAAPDEPLVVLEDEESAWWGSPAAPPSDAQRSRVITASTTHVRTGRGPHGRGRHGRGREHHGRGRGEHRGEHGAEDRAEPRGEHRGGRGGPRGRRRHRGRAPQGGGEAGGPPSGAGESRPEPVSSAGPEGPGPGDGPPPGAPAGPGEPRPEGGGRRRRRRRRRR